MNSKTPTTDPRANKDYGILSMGYFSTCAADHDENSPPYFDCQDSGVVMETTNQRVENDFSDLSEDDIIGCAAVEANGSDDFFDRLKAGHKIKFEKQIINAFKHYAGNLEKRWLVFLYGLDDLLNYCSCWVHIHIDTSDGNQIAQQAITVIGITSGDGS